eukprot:2462932-Prymnesium_polylepis.2
MRMTSLGHVDVQLRGTLTREQSLVTTNGNAQVTSCAPMCAPVFLHVMELDVRCVAAARLATRLWSVGPMWSGHEAAPVCISRHPLACSARMFSRG